MLSGILWRRTLKFTEEMSAATEVKDEQKFTDQEKPTTENKNRMSTTKENQLKTLGEKEKHEFNTGCSLFPIHMWLYLLYIALAVILPIFGTLLIICGNYSNTGYFSLFAILNYPFPGLKVEDPNYTASSLEVLQVRFGLGSEDTLSCPAGSLASSSGCSPSTWSTPSPSTTS